MKRANRSTNVRFTEIQLELEVQTIKRRTLLHPSILTVKKTQSFGF